MTQALPPEFELFNDARHREPHELNSMPRDALMALVVQWLEGWHQFSFFDFEAIEDLGMLVGGSLHKAADIDVQTWAAQRGQPVDYDIAGCFLAGCWRVATPCVDLLGYATLLDGFPPQSRAFAGTLYALCEAMRFDRGKIPTEIKASITQKLKALLPIAKELHPGIYVYLAEL